MPHAAGIVTNHELRMDAKCVPRRPFGRGIVVMGFLVLGSIGLIWVFWPSREPAWDGRTLSYWLQIGYGVGMTHMETDREDADVAVRHIGAAALPFLVRELGTKYSPTQWKLFYLLRNQSVIPVSVHYPDERRSRAVGAFQALGSVGAPALPQLRRYLSDPELNSDAQSAIDAILNSGVR